MRHDDVKIDCALLVGNLLQVCYSDGGDSKLATAELGKKRQRVLLPVLHAVFTCQHDHREACRADGIPDRSKKAVMQSWREARALRYGAYKNKDPDLGLQFHGMDGTALGSKASQVLAQALLQNDAGSLWLGPNPGFPVFLEEQRFSEFIRRPARTAVLTAFVKSERLDILRHIPFPPSSLGEALLKGEAFDLDCLHVPQRVVPRSSRHAAGRDPGADPHSPMAGLGLWEFAHAAKSRYAPPGVLPALVGEGVPKSSDDVYVEWRADQGALVIVGDPGYGKTWLLSRICWRLLSTLENNGGPDETAPLPVRLSCWQLGRELARLHDSPSRLANEHESRLLRAAQNIICNRLTDIVSNSSVVKAVADLIRERFEAHQVVVLVDGWDEREASHESHLSEVLRAWGSTAQNQIILTTRPFGYTPTLFPKAVEWQLVPLDSSSAEQGTTENSTELLVSRWFGESKDGATVLLNQIRGQPDIIQLMREPLLGAIVCWLSQHSEHTTIPQGRTALLKQAIKACLHQGRFPRTSDRARVFADGVNEIGDDLLLALAELAYKTYEGERWFVKVQDFYDALGGSKIVNDLGGPLAVRNALAGRFGLFTVTADDEWEIIHQSFSELLCAEWIVREIDGTPDDLNSWLNHHGRARLLDARWREVWCHVAVLLPDAEPFLRELLDRHSKDPAHPDFGNPALADDAFDTTLCLAGHCLAAIPNHDKLRIAPEIQEQLFVRADANPMRPNDPHCAALAALGHTGQVEHLLKLMTSGVWPIRESARTALKQIGGPAARGLAQLFPGGDLRLKCDILRLLEQMPEAAADAVSIMARALGDNDAHVRQTAASALSGLGLLAASAKHELSAALRDADNVVRYAAARALANTLPATECLDLSAIEQEFADADDKRKEKLVELLQQLGPLGAASLHKLTGMEFQMPETVAVPGPAGSFAFTENGAHDLVEYVHNVPSTELLPNFQYVAKSAKSSTAGQLIDACLDSQVYVRMDAAEALGWLGLKSPEVIAALNKALADKSVEVQISAACALLRLGENSAQPLSVLEHLFRKQKAVRTSLLLSLDGFGSEVLPLLLEAVRDRDPEVREKAAGELFRLTWSGKASPPIEVFVRLLHDSELMVRHYAVATLDAMGPKAKAAVSALCERLADKDEASSVRSKAIWALGRIDSSSKEVRERLVVELRLNTDDTSVAAASVLGASGAIEAVPELFAVLKTEKKYLAATVKGALSELTGLHGLVLTQNGEQNALPKGPLAKVLAPS